MISLSKSLFSSILKQSFKLSGKQSKQIIRFYSKNINNVKSSTPSLLLLNNNNNCNKQIISISSIIQSIDKNKGVSFFNNKIRQYTTTNNKDNNNNNKDNKEGNGEDKESKDNKEEGNNEGVDKVDDENNVDLKQALKRKRATELKQFFGPVGGDKEKEIEKEKAAEKEKEKLEEEKIIFNEGEPSTVYIYSVFTAIFIGVVATAIINQYNQYNNSTTGVLGMQSFDFVLLLQDLYFGELKPTMEEGNPEFNALTKKNFIFDEASIRHQQLGDTITLIVPILQKKTYALLGNVNVDFVKEGKFMTIQNFYINAINGGVYELPAPQEKIDTSRERYSGKYSLEELLNDPTL